MGRLSVCVVIVGIVFSNGCHTSLEPEDSVAFIVSSSSYEIGDTIRAELRNASDAEMIHYHFCEVRFDRLIAGSWELDTGDRVCSAVDYGLTPGSSALYEYKLPTTLPVGTYRLRIGVSAPGVQREFDSVTETFEVITGDT
jgi:hypothetical protein